MWTDDFRTIRWNPFRIRGSTQCNIKLYTIFYRIANIVRHASVVNVSVPRKSLSDSAVLTTHSVSTDLKDPTAADSMTLIVASSTSSSPIHNHRGQQTQHQHNVRYNNLGQYHPGVMTLRRPVVINTQYYGGGGGGGGGTLQRNVIQQPTDVSDNWYRSPESIIYIFIFQPPDNPETVNIIACDYIWNIMKYYSESRINNITRDL